MELTFLGNKYAKSEKVTSRPTIQLKYMGKSYRADQVNSVRNSVVLTYRGVSYSRPEQAQGPPLPCRRRPKP